MDEIDVLDDLMFGELQVNNEEEALSIHDAQDMILESTDDDEEHDAAVMPNGGPPGGDRQGAGLGGQGAGRGGQVAGRGGRGAGHGGRGAGRGRGGFHRGVAWALLPRNLRRRINRRWRLQEQLHQCSTQILMVGTFYQTF